MKQINGGNGFERHLTKNKETLHGKFLKMKLEFNLDHLMQKTSTRYYLESHRLEHFKITSRNLNDLGIKCENGHKRRL